MFSRSPSPDPLDDPANRIPPTPTASGPASRAPTPHSFIGASPPTSRPPSAAPDLTPATPPQSSAPTRAATPEPFIGRSPSPASPPGPTRPRTPPARQATPPTPAPPHAPTPHPPRYVGTALGWLAHLLGTEYAAADFTVEPSTQGSMLFVWHRHGTVVRWRCSAADSNNAALAHNPWSAA